ncbi:hypothetical protein MIMGU_mgv1a017216mg [Erythranthe guttata]|uniref:Mediator of RNA polymerase II transcription subunit 11 n=1 Tax=Erythranthe guttata TaxID=4155 RepID=A0A022QKB3_ERYGU|nr:hypothetical protein MIMGU_mgv1a017216mg [Erythranthe guttata]
MYSRSQTTPTQRLQNLEKRTTRLAELAYEVMEEMANPSGPTHDLLSSHFSDFKQLAQDTKKLKAYTSIVRLRSAAIFQEYQTRFLGRN